MIFDLVYLRLSEEDSAQLYQIWREHNQIPEECLEEDPESYMRRASHRVFYLIKDFQGNIIGSAGVYNKEDGIYFSTFIVPEARTCAALGISLMFKTRDAIKKYNLSQGKMLKVELQNKRLDGPGMTNELKKGGFTYEGKNKEGLSVWSCSLED